VPPTEMTPLLLTEPWIVVLTEPVALEKVMPFEPPGEMVPALTTFRDRRAAEGHAGNGRACRIGEARHRTGPDDIRARRERRPCAAADQQRGDGRRRQKDSNPKPADRCSAAHLPSCLAECVVRAPELSGI